VFDLHLQALAEAAAGGANGFGVDLAGRADLGRLALFGHSRGGGSAVGLANSLRSDRHNSRCDWAYYLAEPSTRGRGVCAQVEYLTLRFVFEVLGLNKLWCEVLIENSAVWHLHESFGFIREALYRDHVRKAGQFGDVIGLGLLARDWPAARQTAESRFLDRRIDLVILEQALGRMRAAESAKSAKS
jgi:hypothetical protein